MGNGLNQTLAPPGRLWWVCLLAIGLAIGANIAFFYIVTVGFNEPLLFPSGRPGQETGSLGLADIFMFGSIFSIGGTAVFIVVVGALKRSVATFVVISIVVLGLSILAPMKIPSPPSTLTAKLVLVGMHGIGAVFLVGTLATLGHVRPRDTQATGAAQ